MDSLDWSRTFDILSSSRVYLRSLGFSQEQITMLSDEDMHALAEDVQNGMSIGFAEDVRFATRIFLAEKQTDDRR